jgi:response regulator RpfG family c-di-GMP phosphodiesterase
MVKKPIMLYVDDEAFNLTIFKLNFKSDFEVLVASSGEEGLNILEKNEVSCIISDMKMPKMNGLDFIGEVKKIASDIPCFILTGVNYSEELSTAKDTDVIKDFFNKPFDASLIRSRVLEYLPG